MKTRNGLLLGLLACVLLSCVTPKVVVTDTPRAVVTQSAKYAEWANAIAAADFDAAEKMAKTENEKNLTTALKALYEKDPLKAEKYFGQAADSASDYRKDLLRSYYFRHGMHQEYADLSKKLNIEIPEIVNRLLAFPPSKIHADKPVAAPIVKLNRGGTPIVEALVNGVRKRFMIDTGFSSTCISKKTAEQGNVKSEDSNLMLVDAHNRAKAKNKAGYIESFQIGGLNIENQPVLVLPDISLRFLGIPLFTIDGVIGWDILQQLNVKIDWKNKEVTFSKSKKSVQNGNLNAITSPFIVMTTDAGLPVFFHLDTGCRKAYFFEAAADRIGKKHARHKYSVSFGMNSNRLDKDKLFKDINLKLGDKNFYFDKIQMMKIEDLSGFVTLHGRTGNNMFKNGIVEFDYQAGYFNYYE